MCIHKHVVSRCMKQTAPERVINELSLPCLHRAVCMGVRADEAGLIESFGASDTAREFLVNDFLQMHEANSQLYKQNRFVMVEISAGLLLGSPKTEQSSNQNCLFVLSLRIMQF